MLQPTCSHCRRGDRTCSKEPDHVILGDANVGIVRRRTRYDLSFDEDQTWMGLPSASGMMPMYLRGPDPSTNTSCTDWYPIDSLVVPMD